MADSEQEKESVAAVCGFVGAEFSAARVRRALVSCAWSVDDAIAMLLDGGGGDDPLPATAAAAPADTITSTATATATPPASVESLPVAAALSPVLPAFEPLRTPQASNAVTTAVATIPIPAVVSAPPPQLAVDSATRSFIFSALAEALGLADGFAAAGDSGYGLFATGDSSGGSTNAVLSTLYAYLSGWSVSALTLATASAYGMTVFAFDSPSPDDRARVRISRQPFSGKSIADLDDTAHAAGGDGGGGGGGDNSGSDDESGDKPASDTTASGTGGRPKGPYRGGQSATAKPAVPAPVVRKAPTQPFVHGGGEVRRGGGSAFEKELSDAEKAQFKRTQSVAQSLFARVCSRAGIDWVELTKPETVSHAADPKTAAAAAPPSELRTQLHAQLTARAPVLSEFWSRELKAGTPARASGGGRTAVFEHLTVAVLGAPKSGKTSVIGQLLHATGRLDSPQLISSADQQLDVTHQFDVPTPVTPTAGGAGVTNVRRYTAVSLPAAGSEASCRAEWISNLVRTDVALLVVDGSLSGDAQIRALNDDEWVRQQCTILHLSRATAIVVVITHMDTASAKWAEKRVANIMAALNSGLLKQTGLYQKHVIAVPVNAAVASGGGAGLSGGENILTRCKDERLTDWYGNGPALIEVLGSISVPHATRNGLAARSDAASRSFLMSVQYVDSTAAASTATASRSALPVGVIESGAVVPGDLIVRLRASASPSAAIDDSKQPTPALPTSQLIASVSASLWRVGSTQPAASVAAADTKTAAGTTGPAADTGVLVRGGPVPTQFPSIEEIAEMRVARAQLTKAKANKAGAGASSGGYAYSKEAERFRAIDIEAEQFAPATIGRTGQTVSLTLSRIDTKSNERDTKSGHADSDADSEDESEELCRVGDVLCSIGASITPPLVLSVHFMAHVLVLGSAAAAAAAGDEKTLSLRSGMPIIISPLRTGAEWLDRLEVSGSIERLVSQLAPAPTGPIPVATATSGAASAVLPPDVAPPTVLVKKKPERISAGQYAQIEFRTAIPVPVVSAMMPGGAYVRSLNAFAIRIPPSAHAHIIQSTPPIAFGVVTEILP